MLRPVLSTPLSLLAAPVRRRVAAAAVAPFGHAPYPLANTLDHVGDPGLLGPGSVSWMVIGDSAAFVGGIRGLLIQAAHPEVVAGVGDHSRYREDPLGRLSRTSAYVTATTYGAMPEVEQAVAQVRRIHRIVSGVSSRGIPYDAGDPALSAWVHNALTDSFLAAHQAYGSQRLTADEADRFVAEQARIGAMLGSDPMPDTAAALSEWIESHPALATSPEMRDAVDFLTDPPLPPTLWIGYKALLEAAAAITPRRIRRILGVSPAPGAFGIGRASVAGLRWALGASPSWKLALIRCEANVPEALFKQPVNAATRTAATSSPDA
jgi:uncharacterized protein (DUF2236 family)